ncbi:hypothetical protein E4U03_12570 [Rothia nasimurium]|uniref:Uncharacterized protein n=1 Tax=Rothia nasimurium TaxID=85336 RepID=A0A4Y9F0U1_9MICC|nr:hypothetical protein [Rothia nasimurium]MBF0809435.1 hypothetical protein [Rothia nasimurium]TFU19024.1 hypothetical protein E4U03_12570 [Rothia nasimurium]
MNFLLLLVDRKKTNNINCDLKHRYTSHFMEVSMTTLTPTRRAALTISLAGLATCLAAGSTTSNASEPGIPAGFKRGKVVDSIDGHAIYEIIDSQGNPQGFVFSASDTRTIRAAFKEIDAELKASPATRSTSQQSTALCAAAIAWFIAQTVFPTAKLAVAAWKLAKVAYKFGSHTVARVWRGARDMADRTAQQEIIDIAKALSGVGGLQACGIVI